MEPTQDEYATRNLFRGTRKVDDNEAGNVSLRAISAGLRKIKDYVSLSLSFSLGRSFFLSFYSLVNMIDQSLS